MFCSNRFTKNFDTWGDNSSAARKTIAALREDVRSGRFLPDDFRLPAVDDAVSFNLVFLFASLGAHLLEQISAGGMTKRLQGLFA